MAEVILNTNKYGGKYVAIKSFTDYTVVASGKSIKEVYKKAESKGYEHPVVFYAPKKDTAFIYCAHS